MKVLVIVHPDLIPPEVVDEDKVEWDIIDWTTEYDVISTLKKSKNNVEVIGIQDSLIELRDRVTEFKPHIIFNLLEEFKGEAIFDQNVVSYLELLGVPYTGCNPKGLILARDKALSKKLLSFHRIKTPSFQVFPKNQPNRKVNLKTFPLIVKCLNEEASRGLSSSSIVNNEKELRARCEFIHEKFNVDAIAEEFIKGTEYFVSVIGNYRLQTYPPRVLQFKKSKDPAKEFYSEKAKFSTKYRENKGVQTAPADIDKDLLNKLSKIAKKTYKVLGLNGYARIDVRVDENQNCYVLEANPNPDIAELDDFSESAATAKVKYKDLLETILKLGRQWSPIKGPQTPIL